MHTSFEDAVEELTRKHPEFAPEAYYFMRTAIDYAADQLNKETTQPHLSAKELYLGACAYALEEYGPLARKVLENWGICTTKDFSAVVYNLIEAGVFGKQKDDTPEDFDQLERLDNLLNAPFALPVDIATALLDEEARKADELTGAPSYGPKDNNSGQTKKPGKKTNSQTNTKTGSKATGGKTRSPKTKPTTSTEPPADASTDHP